MKGWKGVGVLVLVLVGSCCRCGLDVEVLDVEVLDVEGLEGVGKSLGLRVLSSHVLFIIDSQIPLLSIKNLHPSATHQSTKTCIPQSPIKTKYISVGNTNQKQRIPVGKIEISKRQK